MSEELQSLEQIMELYGRGLGGLGRAIRFSAKEAKKGVDYAKVKNIQHKMKLHYASTGEHKTMKLKDLEKLTEIQQKIKDGTTIPISLNFETLLIKENKDSYVMRIPRGRTGNVIEQAMIVKKSDALILDQGQTLLTYLNKADRIKQFQIDPHIFSSGMISERRQGVIRELIQQKAEEDVIKSIVYPGLSELEVQEKKKA